MRISSIDLGSNSFLNLITEKSSSDRSGQLKVLSDKVQIVRLSQGLEQSGLFADEALERAFQCLSEFKKQNEYYQVHKVQAVATAAARKAQNVEKLLEMGKSLSIPIEVISGDLEAELTFQGACTGIRSPVILIDIGGGSTELVLGDGKGQIVKKTSIPVGAVSLTEKFISKHPVSDEEAANLLKSIRPLFQDILLDMNSYSQDIQMLAVAGTPTELAKIEIGIFDSAKIDGFQFSYNRLKDLVDRLKSLSVSDRIEKMGVTEGRADVLFAGAKLLNEILRISNRPSLSVSVKGLRYGLAERQHLTKIGSS